MGVTESNLFLDLIIADCLRGKHGTGIVKIDTKGNSDWRKMEGNPFELFGAEGVAKWYDEQTKDYRFYVGHNRHATTGHRGTDHAHPFTQGHITMIHNGTLFATTSTPKFKDFEVDSEAMCYSISQIGIQETINKTYGAYCIVYWNDQEKTLNLLRNHERPLYIAADTAFDRIAFASEVGMLFWCLNRNQVKMTIAELEENVLYTYDLKSSIPKKTPMGKKFASYFPYKTVGQDTAWDKKNDGFYESHEYLKIGVVWQYVKKGSKEHAKAKAQAAKEAKDKKDLPAIVETKGKKQTELKLVASKEASKSSPPFLTRAKDKGTLRAIDNLFGYHVGDRISFIIRDYQTIPGDKYLLEGFIREFKGLDVFMHISSKGPTLDTLLETFKVRGTIRHMRFNLDNTKNDEQHHQMWLSDPEPVFEGLSDEEASVIIDNKTGALTSIDPFEDPFEGSDAAIL